MKWLLGMNNRKLSKDGIASFGLTAMKTCPFALLCKKYCYANKGAYKYSVVYKAQQRRFKATMQDNFEERIAAEIVAREIKYVRIHDSGDFYNKAYAKKWINIANRLSDIIFYAYTKSWIYFEGLEVPANLLLIQSVGGRYEVDKNKPHAVIYKTVEEIPKDYVDCHKSDMELIKGYLKGKKNFGLVFH